MVAVDCGDLLVLRVAFDGFTDCGLEFVSFDGAFLWLLNDVSWWILFGFVGCFAFNGEWWVVASGLR